MDDRAVCSTVHVPGNCYDKLNNTFANAQQKAEATAHEQEDDMRGRKQGTLEHKIARARRMLADLTALADELFRVFAMKGIENQRFRDPVAMSSRSCSLMVYSGHTSLLP